MATDSGQFIAVCKKEFVFLTNDNQRMPISNIGALRDGLEALQKEDASAFGAADELWARADKLLATESQDDEGAGAQGTVQVNDDFDLASIGGHCGFHL